MSTQLELQQSYKRMKLKISIEHQIANTSEKIQLYYHTAYFNCITTGTKFVPVVPGFVPVILAFCPNFIICICVTKTQSYYTTRCVFEQKKTEIAFSVEDLPQIQLRELTVHS